MNTKQIEALKLALEALEGIHTGNMTPMAEEAWNKAITTLREALAEQPAPPPPPPPPPECQTEAEKTAFAFGWWKALEQKRKVDSALDRMAENARELGLDYEPIVEQVEDSVGMGHGAWDMVEPKKLAKAFHEALAEQPAQQEPVVWMYVNKSTHETKFQKHMRDFVDHSLWSEVPLYGEPLANHELQCVCGAVWLGDELVHLPDKRPPAQRKPLTDEQIDRAIAELGLNYLADASNNRAVLRELCRKAAHGITGEK